MGGLTVKMDSDASGTFANTGMKESMGQKRKFRVC